MRTNSGRGLQPNVLGTFDTIVMAVAGSAPAYSIAATTAVLVASVGLAGPAALFYCAIPMLGIVLAFGRLGRIDVNAGASYSWVGRTVHPFLGFLSGWALVVSATIFMVAGSLPFGAMTLALFDPDLAENTALATATGAAWFLAMLLVVVGGARLTVRAQLLMSGVELAILLFFVVAALLHTGYAAAFDWSWLGFSHFDGPAGFASGALVAAFYYWGWDVTSNLSEETRDSRRTAGLASLVGLGVVFLLFEAFTIAVNMILDHEDIRADGANVLGALGDAIWPGVGGKLLVVAVLLSTVATLETTLIQVTRSLFAMGRDRTMPAALGTVHRRWNTPGSRSPSSGRWRSRCSSPPPRWARSATCSPPRSPRSACRSRSTTVSRASPRSSRTARPCSPPYGTSSSAERGRCSGRCSCSGFSSRH